MSGWIKLHRQFTQWEWYTDVNTCHLFTHLLLEANHTETKWRGHIIMPGQLLTGRIKLAEATGLSQQNVRTSLDKLKSTNEVTSKTYNKYSIITITNWGKYQDINQQVTSELTSNQPATNQQLTTSKNIKNEENEKKDIDNTSLRDTPPLQMVQIWNEKVQPKLTTGKVAISDKRRATLKSLSGSKFKTIQAWESYCTKIIQSPFLLGKNDRKWRITFDWALKEQNINKILEGNYSNEVSVTEDRKTLTMEDIVNGRTY